MNKRKKTIILLVEDDVMTVKTLVFALEREGYRVLVAKDGEEADKMLDIKADLILLDLVMPKKSGFEVLSIIRQEKRLQTPVIILSNLGKDEDIKKGIGLGADDYLVKSKYSIRSIVEKINSALGQATTGK
ncbi:MAG: Transcriptional regulatory protein CpxR [Parcubacteria group bacterium GW2011_GWC1_45_9]|nr:MAG: Transcriptional regulatory protein CpxR [Parcubacteria group bacterium GW2011_GWA1_Parcubacteria_45_10]KKT89159.1 MAG: Transcriptional regulatory protein CpxR [Parcubacteria group bacterium GW2011_GWB1_45_10]KKU17353.1 MAG: Transcriptional regulatory protein CpxR [Parcubacteria group bacterium GW2011_GWC1_45_9]HCI05258.1 hypothetical protein [Patescibacteria group bacterium]